MAPPNKTLPELLPVAGLRLGTTCAGIKKPDHRDLVVMELAEECQVAGRIYPECFLRGAGHYCKEASFTNNADRKKY